jgi:arylsulfatase A-like enzyme/Flp pilus assembly protein TadD
MILGCNGATTSPPATAAARNLVLITVDTLRADHVGGYGYARARTPTLDSLAATGTLFERAYSAAPITLTSHATLMSGRYPPGHGARDNGMHVSAGVPTLATELHARGFRTGAFVAAFPLDHQFGLDRGFDVYSDRLPRGPDGRLANERPGSQVVDEAIAWLGLSTEHGPSTKPGPSPKPQAPFFAWVHLFEPHAPYGDPSAGRPALERYDDEIAVADGAVGRLIAALAPVRAETLIIVTGDHGEAFGEHGEYAHSIFVYDTTLHVPLIMNGPAVRASARVSDPVTLADVAPTAMHLLGAALRDVDGIDLAAALGGAAIPKRELYAESFAPLVEFGWAPLRSIRSGPWKFIAAPKPELFDIDRDAGEDRNVAAAQPSVTSAFASRASRYADAGLPGTTAPDPLAAERLRALGYSSGSRQDDNGTRPDPKDRRELAARIAQVTSGELSGAALVSALEGIVRDDPRNGQAHLRLGFARLQAGDCARAEPEFHAAVSGGLPSADLYIGLASCLGQRNDLAGAERALNEAKRLEPDNPAVAANMGILLAARADWPGAIAALSSALRIDPNLHEARFNLALAYAKSGHRAEAAAAARELVTRLPANAPQRPEVERLLKAVQ